ncbi:efflux transporter [Mycena olivaceomarginata]|nr:efflux transporter [Mycena olivaceomarginata]
MDAPPSSPPPAPTTRSRWRAVAIAGTCTAAMLVNSSNNTSVAIALPTIGGALHTRAAALQWLVSAYPLSSGCLLLFCGHLADVHGRKRVFIGGSLILFAFTLACGFAQDEVTLAVLRGLQAWGFSHRVPAILRPRARRRVLILSAGAPVGGALGMVLGGLVTQLSRYTWRAQFFLSAAIAFATLLVDIVSLLVLSLLLLVLFGLRLASNRFVRAALAYTPPPLLPPSLFARRRGRLGVIYLIALLQFAAFMIWAFWVQLYYQVYIGYSPVRTVVRLVPMFVTGLLCNVLVALLVGRVRIVWLLAGGTLTTMVAPLLFALVVPAAPYWAYGFPAALGTSFGVTASTIVFNHVQQIAYRTQANALGSYHAAMWMGVGFGGLATLSALLAFYGVERCAGRGGLLGYGEHDSQKASERRG